MPFTTVLPLTLSVVPTQVPGQVLVTNTDPADDSQAWVLFPTVLAASNTPTGLPVVPLAPGSLSTVLTLPGDGVYHVRGIQVLVDDLYNVASPPPEEGEVRYYPGSSSPVGFYQYSTSGGWSEEEVDFTTLLPQVGGRAYHLQTSTLRGIYYRLLLLTLERELGPLPANNQAKVDQLTEKLGKLDRGLQGATYLFADTNYTEAARTLDLLALTRYLP